MYVFDVLADNVHKQWDHITVCLTNKGHVQWHYTTWLHSTQSSQHKCQLACQKQKGIFSWESLVYHIFHLPHFHVKALNCLNKKKVGQFSTIRHYTCRLSNQRCGQLCFCGSRPLEARAWGFPDRMLVYWGLALFTQSQVRKLIIRPHLLTVVLSYVLQSVRAVLPFLSERNCVNSWILLADFESALMYLCKYFGWLSEIPW